MKTPLVIPKESVLVASEDYAFLREEGIAYVEQLASEIWTDYNVHDPGVTILEALCYAITDLGRRTSFEVRDILAKENPDPEPPPPIFTARNILSCNPLTITDFRKILVDVDGIRNAWLFVADCQEVDFYAECASSALKYFAADHKIKREKLKDKIATDLINDPENTETGQMRLEAPLEVFDPILNIHFQHRLEIPLPGWVEVNTRCDEFLPFVNLDNFQSIVFQNVDYDNQSGVWQGDIVLNFDREGAARQLVLRQILIKGVTEDAVRDELEASLSALGAENIIVQYRQKLLRDLARLTEHTVNLRGLNEVLLEFETDDQYGDLNADLLRYTLFIEDGSGGIKELRLEALMTSWRDIYANLEDYYAFIQSPALTSVSYENENLDSVNKIWTVDLVLQYDGQNALPDIRLDNLVFNGIAAADEVDALKDNINLLDARSFIGFFRGKLKRLWEIAEAVEFRLHEHRNLCEDYKKISSICVNEIAVCADIMLENGANLLEVQADILFQIQQYLSPPIRFYNLQEMEEMGVPSEDIFNGPKLDHGFILDSEIEASDLQENRCVYASDIINIIMDVPGVKAVKDLLLTKYDKKGRPALPSEKWRLQLDPYHKAELNLDKSKLLYFKDGLPYILPKEKRTELLKKIARLRAVAERYKLKSDQYDFLPPNGTPLSLESYSPLRRLLPETFGVGEEGLPETASDARKGKATQLKAYLAFFDQLLANYLSQLSNLGELFSAKTQMGKEKKTYYTQFLQQEILGENLYYDASVLEDGGGAEIGLDSLQRLSETHREYLDRRNRFLDHLLARFAENFSDYALLVFNVLDEAELEELIEDKIRFLEEYPLISSQRGKGFNYKNEAELWDTDNVAGLKKRMSKLLGMASYQRSDLHCQTIIDSFQVEEINPTDFTFKLNDGGSDLLTSPKHFTTYDEAFYAMEEAILLALDAENYVTEAVDSSFVYQIGEVQRHPVTGEVVNKDVYLESVAQYASDTLAAEAGETFRQELAADFDGEPCEVEGFHVIEHILLRPKNEYEDLLFEVCLNTDCFFCGEDDPYSFRITVVLPYWMEKFLDDKMKIREYVDRLFRQETPAHIHVKICWVSNRQMRLIDWHYRRWLEENAKRFPDKDRLTRRLNALISIMGRLRNVYFQGFLHDCDDSEEENTIVLGKSFLGSYTPLEEGEM